MAALNLNPGKTTAACKSGLYSDYLNLGNPGVGFQSTAWKLAYSHTSVILNLYGKEEG